MDEHVDLARQSALQPQFGTRAAGELGDRLRQFMKRCHRLAKAAGVRDFLFRRRRAFHHDAGLVLPVSKKGS